MMNSILCLFLRVKYRIYNSKELIKIFLSFMVLFKIIFAILCQRLRIKVLLNNKSCCPCQYLLHTWQFVCIHLRNFLLLSGRCVIITLASKTFMNTTCTQHSISEIEIIIVCYFLFVAYTILFCVLIKDLFLVLI